MCVRACEWYVCVSGMCVCMHVSGMCVCVHACEWYVRVCACVRVCMRMHSQTYAGVLFTTQGLLYI